MAINVSVQHHGGFLPGIILLTQCYYHRRTRLKWHEVLYLQPMILPTLVNVLTFPPLTGRCSEGLDVLSFFFKLYCSTCQYY